MRPFARPIPIPAISAKKIFPVAFSTSKANRGETTKIEETEISKLPDMMTIVIKEAAMRIVDC